MPRFIKKSDGTETTADDPERSIWNFNCGYYTDDMGKLALDRPDGVPCCPSCKIPGFQTTAKFWYDGIAAYDKIGPGYKEWREVKKEFCFKPLTVRMAWSDFKEERDRIKPKGCSMDEVSQARVLVEYVTGDDESPMGKDDLITVSEDGRAMRWVKGSKQIPMGVVVADLQGDEEPPPEGFVRIRPFTVVQGLIIKTKGEYETE